VRDVLAILEGSRGVYRALVVRLGSRPISPSIRQRTVLLRHVATAEGEPITDHLWLPIGRRLAEADPRPGDLLEFAATVVPYIKQRDLNPDGTVTGGVLDYRLGYVAGVRKLPCCAPPGVPIGGNTGACAPAASPDAAR